jgi:hypothetical protein
MPGLGGKSMGLIEARDEAHLVNLIKASKTYAQFREKFLTAKTQAEEKAWKLLVEKRGNLSREVLTEVFDTVDLSADNKPWFGDLLGAPNRNLIFESSPERTNEWFEYLLFSEGDYGEKVATCLTTLKIKGASKGLTTLFLYLSDSENYNIWLPAIEGGLNLLGRTMKLKESSIGNAYKSFNSFMIDFRIKHQFLPQEMDWILSLIQRAVIREGDQLLVNEEVLDGLKHRIDPAEDLAIRSWSRTPGIDGLLGKKTVDWSIFVYGTHIPVKFTPYFEKANSGVHLNPGEKHDINLIIDLKIFKANLFNIKRKGLNADTLQIRYDTNKELKHFFQEKFRRSYDYLIQERPKGSKKTHVLVPKEFAEYIEFYRTEKPFEYELRLIIWASEPGGLSVNIWWVNQGKTFEVEREGEFLWAPLKSIDGKALYHWENMAEVRQGDIIVHYSGGSIRAVSQVTEGPVEAVKPPSLTEEAWTSEGRLVHSRYHDLSPIIPLSCFSDALLALKFVQGPLDKDGKVKQGYLFRLSKEVLKLMQESQPQTDWPDFAKGNEVNRRFWLFQANPKYYDLTGAILELKEMAWEVNQYSKEIHKGDRVFLWEAGKDAGIVGIGTILSDPVEMGMNTVEDKFAKDVERFSKETLRVRVSIDQVPEKRIRREDLLTHPLLKDLEVIKFANATNFKVRTELAEELQRLFGEETGKRNPEYSLADFSQDVGLDEELIRRWVRAIERKNQAIFYGPPGTGKTYVAESMAKHLIGGGYGFYELVQFHPAYSYEDFIEGIRPQANNKVLEYPMVPGRFLAFCQRARSRKDTCVLIIDEINRANLSRVLGELMYLLEYREKEIELAGGKKFAIPRNVRILGTLNTADRSIALVDHALRRRFAFLELYPKYEILERYHAKTGIQVSGLIDELKLLNRQINDRHYEVGVSFFLRDDLAEQIEDIWRMEIEPYLEEYFFDQQEKVNQFRWEKVKDKILA